MNSFFSAFTQKNIVQTASADPRFKNLVSALQKTGLVQTLQGAGPFTVFAPVDAAFAGVDVSRLSQDQLRDLLLYHVVPGNATLQDGAQLRTVQGEVIDVRRENGRLLVNDAVVIAEIPTSNGTIYVIDSVLNAPPDHRVREQVILQKDPYGYLDDYLRKTAGCNYVHVKCHRRRCVRKDPCCNKVVTYGKKFVYSSSSSSSSSSCSSSSSSSCSSSSSWSCSSSSSSSCSSSSSDSWECYRKNSSSSSSSSKSCKPCKKGSKGSWHKAKRRHH